MADVAYPGEGWDAAGAREILIATNLRESGESGIQTHFNELRRYLSANRIESALVTPHDYNKAVMVPTFAVRRMIDPLSGRASVWWYRELHALLLKSILKRRLGHGRAAVVYAQDPLAAKAAREARASPDQKVVLAVHFSNSQADEWAIKGRIARQGRLYAGIKRVEREVMAAVDGLVFPAANIREDFERDNPAIRSVPSAIVPNFLAVPGPSPGPVAAAGDLISMGTLEPRKNHLYLLDVLSEARRLGQRYSLTLVGDGPERHTLDRRVATLRLEDQVRFLGYRPDGARYMPGHRVYVHSALLENFPLSPIHALSHGLPVIAAPVGGISDIIADGVEGRYWPLEDSAKGARTLISLLEDPKTHARMVRAAREKFRTEFEASKVAPRLLAFLMSRLEARKAPVSPAA